MAEAYDKTDMIRRVGLMQANGLKLAAYTVRDLETGKHGALQFHMTYNNTVMAVMGEEAAKLFSTFVAKMVSPEPEVLVRQEIGPNVEYVAPLPSKETE
jgi:hypothetical protein